VTLRTSSTLPAELDQLVSDTIGCCVRVHCALGPGLLENIVAKAVCIELEAVGVAFERERNAFRFSTSGSSSVITAWTWW
jgi:PD-(D/E)XK nuclease superfamily